MSVAEVLGERIEELTQRMKIISNICEEVHQRSDYPKQDEYGDDDYDYAYGKIQGQKDIAERINKILRKGEGGTSSKSIS